MKSVSSGRRPALVATLVVLLAAGCSSASPKAAVKTTTTTTTAPLTTSTTRIDGGPLLYSMPTGPDAQVLTSACGGLGSLEAVYQSAANQVSVAPMAAMPTSEGSPWWSMQQLATATTSSQIADVRYNASQLIKAWQSDEVSPGAVPPGVTGRSAGWDMIQKTWLAWSEVKSECVSFGLSSP